MKVSNKLFYLLFSIKYLTWWIRWCFTVLSSFNSIQYLNQGVWNVCHLVFPRTILTSPYSQKTSNFHGGRSHYSTNFWDSFTYAAVPAALNLKFKIITSLYESFLIGDWSNHILIARYLGKYTGALHEFYTYAFVFTYPSM